MVDPRDDEILRLKAKVNQLIRSNQELKFQYDSKLQSLSEELGKTKEMQEASDEDSQPSSNK